MIANIRKAIWDRETVTIGGGQFSGEELRLLLRQAQLGAAIERACQELPPHYEINISLEKDAGTVELVTASGVTVDIEGQDTFAQCIEAAIARANTILGKGKP